MTYLFLISDGSLAQDAHLGAGLLLDLFEGGTLGAKKLANEVVLQKHNISVKWATLYWDMHKYCNKSSVQALPSLKDFKFGKLQF